MERAQEGGRTQECEAGLEQLDDGGIGAEWTGLEGAVWGQDGDETQAELRSDQVDRGGTGKGTELSIGGLVEPFIPPDSYRAVLCPQPRPRKAYS